MKAEALEEADRCRKHQGSDKGKGEGAIVDLPFMLISRAKKTRQEQDRHPRSNDGQSEQGRAERRTLTLNADSNDGENRGEIEEYERGSAPTSELVLKGLPVQGTPPQRHLLEYVIAIYMSRIRYLLYAIRLPRRPETGPQRARQRARGLSAAGRATRGARRVMSAMRRDSVMAASASYATPVILAYASSSPRLDSSFEPKRGRLS